MVIKNSKKNKVSFFSIFLIKNVQIYFQYQVNYCCQFLPPGVSPTISAQMKYFLKPLLFKLIIVIIAFGNSVWYLSLGVLGEIYRIVICLWFAGTELDGRGAPTWYPLSTRISCPTSSDFHCLITKWSHPEKPAPHDQSSGLEQRRCWRTLLDG